MLSLKYLNERETYSVSFSNVSKNIVQITGNFPIKTSGFMLSWKDNVWDGDYSDYTTVYREIDGGVQFSNDGSVWIEPEPTPELEPYIPTLEEIKEQKVAEMNSVQQITIQNGIDVTLLDGTVEHFSLTDRDQDDLDSLKDEVNEGREKIPWHVDDESIHCKYYSNEDMRTITTAAKRFVTYHVTYFRDLRIYIRSMNSKEDVETVYYGIYVPRKYQSEVLTDFYNEMSLNGE